MSVFEPDSRELAAIRKLTESETDRTIPEAIFVRDFIPFFRGEVDDKQKYDELLTAWLIISGTPTNEVAVVDENNKELFKVPPHTDTTAIIQRDRNKGEVVFSNVIGHVISQSGNSAFNSERFLERAAAEVVPSFISVNSEKRQEYVDRWNSILARYAPTTADSKKEEASKPVSVNAFSGDGESFDID